MDGPCEVHAKLHSIVLTVPTPALDLNVEFICSSSHSIVLKIINNLKQSHIRNGQLLLKDFQKSRKQGMINIKLAAALQEALIENPSFLLHNSHDQCLQCLADVKELLNRVVSPGNNEILQGHESLQWRQQLQMHISALHGLRAPL